MNSDGHLYLSALLLSWLHWAAWPAFLLEAFAWGSLRMLAEVGSWLRVSPHALELPAQQSPCFSVEATFLITSKLFKYK